MGCQVTCRARGSTGGIALPQPLGVSDSRRHPTSPDYTIDAGREQLIALSKLPNWYEERTGRPLHRTVPYGWRTRGIKTTRGLTVCLPTIKIGGIRYTSVEAIAWWTAAIEGSASRPVENLQ